MKTKYKLFSLMILFVIGSLGSCQKIGEYYLGLHLQPNMDNSPPLSGLNVFGVLKTGDDFDSINHFFEVQQMISLSDTISYINDIATIQLKRTTTKGDQFYYYPEFYGDDLYFDEEIETAVGDRWDYSCLLDTFEVVSSCIIPNTPVILNRVEYLDGAFNLTIRADETAFMYTIYLLNGDHFYSEKKVSTLISDTKFSIKPDWEIEMGSTTLIYVFAYDKNIREYNTTSNTLFKPNAFRPSFSTVEGGYGTFGAISSCLEVVN